MAKRKPTEQKTAFAGVILEISFAWSRASTVAFNEERVSSCPLDSWGVAAIVKTGGDCEKTG
jgi:hypothetical protein